MNACLIFSVSFRQKRYEFRLIFSEFNFVSATFIRNALYSVKYFACLIFFFCSVCLIRFVFR
jgi:hypothetical protein